MSLRVLFPPVGLASLRYSLQTQRQMFTLATDELLHTLDHMVGDRRRTCDVLALASATVLTAAPIDRESSWLDEVRQKIPKASDIMVSARFRQQAAPSNQSYERAVGHLLDTLERQHEGEVQAILSHLSRLSGEALARLPLSQQQKWSDFVTRAKDSIHLGYLSNHPDLN